MILRPILASQAPNVRIIRAITGIFVIFLRVKMTELIKQVLVLSLLGIVRLLINVIVAK